MGNRSFDDILKRMPEIAKVVNEFQTPELQVKAFHALMKAAGLHIGADEPSVAPSPEVGMKPQRRSRGKPSATTKMRPRERHSRDEYSIVDVNLHPDGQPSLKDFFREKKPKTDPQKYICIIHYMRNHAGVEAVSTNHIYTAFKQLGQKVPNIQQGLRNTRARYAWVQFTGRGCVALTRIGENAVEHELPREVEEAGDDG